MRTGPSLRSTLAAGFLLASILGVVSGSSPAAANEGAPLVIHIKDNEKAAKTYDGMVVNDASSNFTGDPETCASAPFCTTVPLQVLVADNFDPDINEFVLTVKLNWEATGFSVQGQSAQGNDLDMYILHQQPDADGNPEWVEVGKSAGSSEPEVAKLFTPALKDYAVVVYNFTGVNNGFQLSASYRDASIEDPGDFSGSGTPARPAAASTSDSSDSDGGVGGTSSDTGTRPSFAGASRSTPTSPSFLPSAPDSFGSTGAGIFAVPTAPDDGSVFDLPTGSERDLSADLAPTGGQDIFKPRIADLHPDPASAVLMGFWLGVVPLVLLGAVGVIMLRRRPAAMTLHLPKPSTA